MASSVVEAFSITHAQVLDGSTAFLAAAFAAASEAEDIYGVNESSLSPDSDSYDNEGDDIIMSTWDWLNKADVEIQAGYLSFPLIANITGQTIEQIDPAPAVDAVQTITVTAIGGTFTLSFRGQETTAIAFGAVNSAVIAALEALTTVDTGDIVVTGAAGTYVLTFSGPNYAGQVVPMVVVDDTLATGGTVTIVQTTAGQGVTAESYGLDLWHEDSFNIPPKPTILTMPSKDKLGVIRRLTVGLYKVQFKPIEFDGPQYKEGLKVNMNGSALLSAFDELGQPHADGKRKVGRLLSHA